MLDTTSINKEEQEPLCPRDFGALTLSELGTCTRATSECVMCPYRADWDNGLDPEDRE